MTHSYSAIPDPASRASRCLWALLGLLAVAGCASRPPQRPFARQEPPPDTDVYFSSGGYGVR